MEGTSQIILRNAERLGAAPVLLVNPPRDGLGSSLRPAPELRCSSQDFGDCRWLRAAGWDAQFEAVPTLRGDEGLVVLHLPREKERLALLLHVLAAAAPPRVWLVGENRAGIKSAGTLLGQRFGRVAVLDRARHCALWEAADSLPAESFVLADYLRDWTVDFANRTVRLRSLPGVFAHGRLDVGTDLLLRALEPLLPRGRVLDFACGSGVVGLALRVASNDVQPTLLDSSALALESSRHSLSANGLAPDVDVPLVPSDGFAELDGRFDWILSNPPFHRGVRDDLDVAAAFIRGAGAYLSKTGKMVVVFNRHLPHARWLEAAFGTVERLVQGHQYQVMMAANPRAAETGNQRPQHRS